jgi:aryl-alcohol dehydrogenase (NADP+)
MQNHYNLIYREEEREMIPLCIDQGVGVIPWSPLARGFFARSPKPESGESTTKRAETDEFARNMYFRDDDFKVADAVADVARERGVTPTQVACAWIMQAPGVTAPIIGATKTHHLKELFDAVDMKLSAEEVEAIEKPYHPHPIIGHEQPQPAKMVN